MSSSSIMVLHMIESSCKWPLLNHLPEWQADPSSRQKEGQNTLHAITLLFTPRDSYIEFLFFSSKVVCGGYICYFNYLILISIQNNKSWVWKEICFHETKFNVLEKNLPKAFIKENLIEWEWMRKNLKI